MVGEVSLALVAVFAAGLLSQSVRELAQVDPGLPARRRAHAAPDRAGQPLPLRRRRGTGALYSPPRLGLANHAHGHSYRAAAVLARPVRQRSDLGNRSVDSGHARPPHGRHRGGIDLGHVCHQHPLRGVRSLVAPARMHWRVWRGGPCARATPTRVRCENRSRGVQLERRERRATWCRGHRGSRAAGRRHGHPLRWLRIGRVRPGRAFPGTRSPRDRLSSARGRGPYGGLVPARRAAAVDPVESLRAD